MPAFSPVVANRLKPGDGILGIQVSGCAAATRACRFSFSRNTLYAELEAFQELGEQGIRPHVSVSPTGFPKGRQNAQLCIVVEVGDGSRPGDPFPVVL